MLSERSSAKADRTTILSLLSFPRSVLRRVFVQRHPHPHGDSAMPNERTRRLQRQRLRAAIDFHARPVLASKAALRAQLKEAVRNTVALARHKTRREQPGSPR